MTTDDQTTDPTLTLDAYVRATVRPLSAELEQILREMYADRSVPKIQVDPEVGQLLKLLVMLKRPRSIVEIGTLFGFSTAYLAQGLGPEGRVITIERDARHAELARAHMQRLGLAQQVEVRVGEALAVLSELDAQGPFDMIVIDADKHNYPNYLKWSAQQLAEGGLLVADDAFAFGHILDRDFESTRLRDVVMAVRAYNHVVCRSPQFVSTILPTKQGLTLSVRRGPRDEATRA